MAEGSAFSTASKSMTKAPNRNDDLIPMIAKAIDCNKAGDSDQREICIQEINLKLIQRGDDPSEFWTSWLELMKALG